MHRHAINASLRHPKGDTTYDSNARVGNSLQWPMAAQLCRQCLLCAALSRH